MNNQFKCEKCGRLFICPTCGRPYRDADEVATLARLPESTQKCEECKKNFAMAVRAAMAKQKN